MKWTDAEYEVVGGPYRVGERHRAPGLKRWRYAGPDGLGRPRWYRSPRLTRAQIIGAVVGAFLAFQAALYALAWVLDHHWFRWTV